MPPASPSSTSPISSLRHSVALRIGSPFIIYSIIVNFTIGVTNKLMPQLPVFFIATPFVLIGGLFLLLMTAPDFIEHFEAAFAAWLLEG